MVYSTRCINTAKTYNFPSFPEENIVCGFSPTVKSLLGEGEVEQLGANVQEGLRKDKEGSEHKLFGSENKAQFPHLQRGANILLTNKTRLFLKHYATTTTKV